MTHKDEALDHEAETLDNQYDDLSDPDRYESTYGYEPPYQHQKLLDDHRKKDPFIFPSDNLLEVRPAGEWLEEATYEPPATQLFGDFWKEGDLTILFADTGTGKSILATQIAESIARGHAALSVPGAIATGAFELPTADRQLPTGRSVLYLDFELSTAQFIQRYSSMHSEKCKVHNSGHCALCTVRYAFSPAFLRSQIRWDNDLPKAFKTFAEFMAHSICQRLFETEAKVLIVDNISFLATANTSANSALQLMRELKRIKSDLGISILVLAHTPKRPVRKPLTVNDLAGSKMLANFADNLFAIGTSIRGKDLRYIKEIKVRNHAVQYDESNVIVCRIEKIHSPCVSSPHVSKGSTPPSASSPPYAAFRTGWGLPAPERGVADASSDGVVLSGASRPFLGFSFVEFDHERHHTTRPYDTTNADRAKLIAAARELANEGNTQRDIAEILGIGKGTVGRYLSNDANVAVARTQ